MENTREIICNRIRTPDGTILISHHVHDYVTHIDKNGKEYMVDGGNCYLRRNVHSDAPHEELTVYSDAPFEEIRQSFYRGTHGKSGIEPIRWTKLCEMSDAWIKNVLSYLKEHKVELPINFFEEELKYREKNNISISE